jgi:hypothetical protein
VEELNSDANTADRYGRRHRMKLRKVVYSLGWLAALAVALGASWKN